MPDVQTSTTSDPRLALRAIIDHELKTFPIRDGMVIGTDPECDILVPEGNPRHFKVRVFGDFCRLFPADPEIKLRDSGSRDCAWLPMRGDDVRRWKDDLRLRADSTQAAV